MGKVFTDTFESKLIYIIRINQKSHQGLLKIGETTVKTDEPLETLQPNSRILNQAAKKRVNTYTNTAGIQYELLHTELAIRNVKDKKGNIVLKTFKDYDVHAVLTNSLFKKHTFDKATGQEWFKTDLDTALEAIAAVKRNEFNLSGVKKKQAVPIIFRPEQEQAITQTLKQFEKGTRMLWNAKMRFGKTLCALEVVRRSKFKKTLIMTHRPVVDQGWYEEFGKIFLGKSSNYIYGSKKTGTSSSLDSFINSDKNFIYFASIQDLRESSFVGGKYEKNDEVFETVWDCVIVDEAHEGTTTELGDEVISTVIKENLNQTKLLELSGTPFNIIGNYDDNIFTWDYIMEQKQKEDWYENTFGDSNPYLNLPQLKIFTYDLDKKFKYSEIEDKAFNFREFFRVWTGDIGIDKKRIPENQKVGDFVHRDDIWSFLNLLTKKDDETEYPFSTEKYRSLFRHSLWMIPGVKEAKALSKLMKSHPMFGNGTFQIVNVAGDGDKDEESKDALEKVQTAIKNAGTEGYTITLSCGRLTTGVTIPEWTAVFYLAGSFSTSAANYLQTIFRVQSPCNINGKIKTSAYVFDFAPDRTLKMVAESVTISTRAGKTKGSDRNILGEFLNYCPVISIEGSTMKKYSTNRLLQQLKRAYAERVVQNGFDDYNLYNDDLLRLDNIEIEKFQKLKGIIGSTRSSHSAKEIKMNEQGFTEEEYELIERIKRKRKIERTPEEEAKLAEANEKTKQARNARSILRGISIRMPLLIYGVDIDFDEDITMEKLVKEVDDSSWEEFMPKGVTKEIFKDFIKYYDPEVFAVAGRKIRDITKGADELSPTERVKQISQIFSKFKNPDKETVLTPWRVVNMHMGDTLGGYNFYKNDYKEVIREDEEPYLIEHEKVTQDTLSNKDSKILEINSKTGLYPLYLTYSIFKERCKKYEGDKLTREIEEKAWEETLKENIYIICKTPMAKSITNRTLTGYRDLDINASYFDDLNNMMRNKSKQFVDKVSRANYWDKKGVGKMKFNAVVGNPPYQENISSSKGNTSLSRQLFPAFIQNSINLQPKYVSLITPARWFAGDAQDKSFLRLRDFLRENNHISKIYFYEDEKELFNNVTIKGGLTYFLYDKNHKGELDFINIDIENNIYSQKRNLFEDDLDVVISNGKDFPILQKVRNKDFISLTTITKGRNAFGIVGKESVVNKVSKPAKFNGAVPLRCKSNEIRWINPEIVKKNRKIFESYKVFIAKSAGDPKKDRRVLSRPYVAEPFSASTDTFIPIGSFDNKIEAINLQKYIRTKFLRFMVSILKVSQNVYQNVYQFVPLQDFTNESDIPWDKSTNDIDQTLYKKYSLTDEEIEYMKNKIEEM